METIKETLQKIYASPTLRGLYISNAASVISSYLRESNPLVANLLQFLTMLYAKNQALEQNSDTFEHIKKIERELQKIETKLEPVIKSASAPH